MERQEADRFPWYDVVRGVGLQQGDILFDCPIASIRPDTLDAAVRTANVVTANAIVMTQSCDLALREDGRPKAAFVMMCPLYDREELANHPPYDKHGHWEQVRQGRILSEHVLHSCSIPGHQAGFRLVMLQQAFTVGADLAVALAARNSPRLRLNPPYREHLAQAFARLFMRVGLPVDIPRFTADSFSSGARPSGSG